MTVEQRPMLVVVVIQGCQYKVGHIVVTAVASMVTAACGTLGSAAYASDERVSSSVSNGVMCAVSGLVSSQRSARQEQQQV